MSLCSKPWCFFSPWKYHYRNGGRNNDRKEVVFPSPNPEKNISSWDWLPKVILFSPREYTWQLRLSIQTPRFKSYKMNRNILYASFICTWVTLKIDFLGSKIPLNCNLRSMGQLCKITLIQDEKKCCCFLPF